MSAAARVAFGAAVLATCSGWVSPAPSPSVSSNPSPGCLNFDNTARMTALVNGLPDFYMQAGVPYMFVFTPNCQDCVFSLGEVGLYLRRLAESDASLSATVLSVTLDAYGKAVVGDTLAGPQKFDIELFDTVLPYTLPFGGSIYVPLVSPPVGPIDRRLQLEIITPKFALQLTSSVDLWWRFPTTMPALPTQFTAKINSFQFVMNSTPGDTVVYAQNPPTDTDYYPSIMFACAQEVMEPTPSPTSSQSASVSPSPSATRSGSPTVTSSPSSSPAGITRRLWTSTAATPSVTATTTRSPCVGTVDATFFSNIFDEIPILELLDEVRLKALQPFAINFKPPCSGCTFTLHGLAMVLKATVPTPNVTLRIELCQYTNDGTSTVGCLSGPAIPAFELEDLPRIVHLPLHTSYSIPASRVGDMKLIITPSANIQWMLTETAPGVPHPGATRATRVQVQPPCPTEYVQAATNSPPPCPDYVPNWSTLGVFPSMHLHGVVPCFVHPPACALHKPLKGPTDNALLAQQCHAIEQTNITVVNVTVNGTFNATTNITSNATINTTTITTTTRIDIIHVVDTIKDDTLTNTAPLIVVPVTKAYTLWFNNPCFGQADSCRWAPTVLTIPLQALSTRSIDVDVYVHNGDPGSPAIYGFTQALNLPPNTVISFQDIDLAPLAELFTTTTIGGISLIFSHSVLWHYGLPLVSFSRTDFPLFTIEPATGTLSTGLYYGFILPGIHLEGVFIDGTGVCIPETSLFESIPVAAAHSLISFCPATPLNATATPPPIPCFGSGSIVVADNTLSGRFLFEGYSLMVPGQRYAVAFDLPCTRCNVHLTHLTLPLSVLTSTSVTFTITVGILYETTPGDYVYDPTINAAWTGIGASIPVVLSSPQAFYTVLLPEAFTLVPLPDAREKYVLIITVSDTVMWHDALAPPMFSLLPSGYTDPYARMLVEVDPFIYERSMQVPGVWIRSWTEPWLDCLSPGSSPTGIPVPTSGAIVSATRTPLPALASASPSRIPIGILGFISFEIIFWVPSLDPSDFLDDAPFFFLFRLTIAIFFNVPVTDVSCAGFSHMPGFTPWLSMDPFGSVRQLRNAVVGLNARALQDSTGMSVRMNVISQRTGTEDRTDELVQKLYSAEAQNMLDAFADNPAAQAKGITQNAISIDTSRASYVGGSPLPADPGADSSSSGGSTLSGGAIAGIVIGCVAAVALVAAGVVAYRRSASTSTAGNAVQPQPPAVTQISEPVRTEIAPRRNSGPADVPPATVQVAQVAQVIDIDDGPANRRADNMESKLDDEATV